MKRFLTICILRRSASRLAAALFALLLGTAAWAQGGCPPAAAVPNAEQMRTGLQHARDRGFLWRVRKGSRTSFLYGTVHAAKTDWTFPGAAVLDAVRASDVVALELDLLDPAIVSRMRAAMAATRQEHAVPAELTLRLQAQLQAACLPGQLMDAMSPEMVAATLLVMSARAQGLDPANGIDMVVSGLGHALHKAVSSLETPELQLSVLQGRTPKESQDLVQQALDELETGQAQPMLARIAQAWAESRFDELEHYEQWCDCLNTDGERAMYKRLLEDRNPALAEQIDAMHASGRRVFAAVGSLHMIGRRGLPALMAQRGYQVERVEFKP